MTGSIGKYMDGALMHGVHSMIREDLVLSRTRWQTGPGRRSLFADHKRVDDALFSETPAGERMRAVVDRRAKNWKRQEKQQ